MFRLTSGRAGAGVSRSSALLAGSFVVVSLALSFLVGNSLALAGAWTLQKGAGQVIGTLVFSQSPGDLTGGLYGDTKTEFTLFTEYGMTRDLTLIAVPGFRRASVGASTSSGPGYFDFGARYQVFSKGAAVASVQGIARIPGASDPNVSANLGHTNAEYDLRGLLGYGFKLGENEAFVDIQAGYRYRTAGPADEVRADLSVGYRLRPDLLLIGQSFNTVSVGEAQGGFRRVREHKLQVSAVYDINARLSVQAGSYASVYGENALRERAVFSAVWVRF
ncbi:hypothetical protein [Afifella marina]|uniref:MetA-pathway of phenol degradation n=1 Tax=Afifella marina DSM 2698 TaxID=1120955 RepID=A0A1G5N084_AFIMA|nr:hypothetical protein [Afifella marina]MBK1622265.1 hypothetical protein [Afifella marina DSM 2698]MBK1628390.1 hypothetical protein [Afifella marina]MBK5919049.1 hypothetical protein [Afifella marina]RAI20212.1 hypothetical protein CH311_10325 [Afifella marina DSM 2698]SCZ30837.1 hypothetical protein SAMN03080610_01300 [Afifella marina DSM 2698]